MELTDTDYQPRDLRVHRNYIIITSFILLFLKTGGVTIDSINILGVSFDFENIDAIFWGLWAILLYGLLRFWGYVKTYSIGYLIQSFKDYRDLLFKKRIKKLINQKLSPASFITMSNYGQTQEYPVYGQLQKTSMFIRKTKVKAHDNVEGSLQEIEVDIELHSIKHFWYLYIPLTIKYLINRPQFWEIIFPIGFGISAILICNINSWPGSLIQLINPM